ncbi:MBOAT family O-acyltransferase [Flavobacterium hauense]
MLFNSIQFAFFLPIVFLLYWWIGPKNLRKQNILLFAASYFFYACWDWRFLFLLMFSTLLDYYTGLKMEDAKSQKIKKIWFWISICINLGFLGTFKYYNFFAESFADAVSNFGLTVNPTTLNIILPVGISFYTFHGLSYVIDIYKGRITAEKNFIDYALFVSFFPLLVAGPIERATHLLPQIKRKRIFNLDNMKDGLRQILWGLFKKVVIADQCAQYANAIFNNSDQLTGSSLAFGALFFTFQMYGDFSGYSDIAIGTAKLFGIDLLRNFAYPYFSRDIAEFYRRWHISLSSWLRDYIYIPLGGSKTNTLKMIRNIFIVFILSGFWHGANWTFIAWGTLNAIYFLPLILTNTHRKNIEIAAKGRFLPSLVEVRGIMITFGLTAFSRIFFRAESISHAFSYIGTLFSPSLFSAPDFEKKKIAFFLIGITLIFLFIEWIGREQPHALKTFGLTWSRPVRWTFYYVLIFAIIVYGGKEQQFIYFQF